MLSVIMVPYKTHLMVWLTDAEDTEMQVKIHLLMNTAVNNQLHLDLDDIYLGRTLQISCESLNTL